ncbi:MAG: ABC transporter ATP-binding protein [Candidatus Edwardsbacteria bacterium]|nr:ABC transporter ATP-binding protein [Candidatus Edwardsbacteria bacterium]
MSDTAITSENIGKQYRIGARRQQHDTLRDAVASGIRRWWWGSIGRTAEDTIWALRDVSFKVKQGEVVGIIGRNGAGKTTLLKIISRITEPSAGIVEMNGRVASLLEVGTGFHPELTGRENIFLNGSILGMRRAEIRRKFDEIVAFAEVEKFIDTPVKHYSSGMYVRLAFAVAAHLEPEILLVDEVLAVGDAQFQKKCLGKMEDISRGGRTILFVSHNMAAVTGLCSKAIVLQNGAVDYPIGAVDGAIQQYLLQVKDVSGRSLAARNDRQGEGKIRIDEFTVHDAGGKLLEFAASGQKVELRIHYRCVGNHQPRNVTAAISLTSFSGTFITMLGSQLAGEPFDRIAQRGYFSCVIKKLPLAAGSYTVNIAVRQNDIIQDWVQEAAVLQVEGGDFFGTGRLPPSSHGGMYLVQEWSVNKNAGRPND